MKEQSLLDQREAIQEDLICILDGLDSEIIDNVCQVVVDRFEILLNELKGERDALHGAGI